MAMRAVHVYLANPICIFTAKLPMTTLSGLGPNGLLPNTVTKVQIISKTDFEDANRKRGTGHSFVKEIGSR